MIEAAIVCGYLAFVNELDLTGKTMYPSGAKAIDKYPQNPTPASPFPYLKLNNFVSDGNGNILEPSVYEVRIEADKLIFVQSGDIKGIFKINTMDMLDKPMAIPSVELVKEQDKTVIIYKAEQMKVQCFLFNNREY